MIQWPRLELEATTDYTGCSGCGQHNPIGLKLAFRKDGNGVRAEFTAGEAYQGWPGIVHGGILMCLLDEAAGWAVYGEGIRCVTAKMQVELKRPAPVNKPLIITGKVTRRSRRLVEMEAAVTMQDGTVVALGKATQFVVDHEERGGQLLDDAGE